jgi:protein ImuA
MTSTPELVRQLQNRIRGLEQARPATLTEGLVSSGCTALDRLFPEGGLRRGSLVEWLTAGTGCGAATLALICARQACQDGGALVVVDRLRQVYPPALAAWGLDLKQVILLVPPTKQDEFWVWDQALRCPGVAAVWGWVEQLDGRRFRRLQLSAETSDVLGLLIRPAQLRPQPTWAEVRLEVEGKGVAQNSSEPFSAGRRLQVRLLHGRGSAGQGDVQLALDEWTGELREVRESHATATRDLVAQLARATTRRLPTGTCGAGGCDL